MHQPIIPSISILISLLVCLQASAQSEHDLLLEGCDAYNKQDYAAAVQLFELAAKENPDGLKSRYNLGNAYYQQKDYIKAAQNYEQSFELSPTNNSKAKVLYNWGNCLLMHSKAQLKKEAAQQDKKGVLQNLKSAIEHYKESLRLQPQDYDAKINLATAFKLLRENSPPKTPPNQGKQQKQQNQKIAPSNNIDKNEEQNKNKDLNKLMKMIEQEDKKVQQKLMKKEKKTTRNGQNDW